MAAPSSDPADGIHVPVGHDDSNDSAFEDDISDTTSISSTIMRHRYENGRRYHKFREGAYWGPNDDAQNDQLDIGHHMLRLLIDDKLFLAPVEKPQKVLDVGCGTGIWSIDFADEHPDCQVIGTDLSPTQPHFCPPNCQFEVDDCTEPWTFPKNSFDMIHVRCLFGSVADWPAFYREVYDHLKPGGWINQMEMAIQFKADDGTCPPDHTMAKWSKLFIETAEKFGKTMQVVDSMKAWVTDAGFEDVREVRYKLPVGAWSSDPKLKEVGRWNLLYCYHGCEGWAMFLLTHVLKWKYEEVMVLVAKFKEALKDRKTHAYYDVSIVYARKPGIPQST